MLTKRKVLCVNNNEVSYTRPDPVDDFTGQVDLTITKSCILSHDDWRLVDVPKYTVDEVELPDWLATKEWADQVTRWKWFWGLGGDPEWGEAWQRKLAYSGWDAARKLAAIKLLRTRKFRSAFRASLRAQLEAWLDGDTGYDSPFSPKQWGCLLDTYTVVEVKRLDAGLYNRR